MIKFHYQVKKIITAANKFILMMNESFNHFLNLMALVLPSNKKKNRMKKLLPIFAMQLFTAAGHAQILKGVLNKVVKKDSTGKTVINKDILAGNNLSNDDIINGLKEALRVGTDSSTKKLSKLDGYFADAAIKILMPEEALKVEKTLRSLSMGNMIDKAILSMNRAAEDAAKGVGNIFWNSIKKMTITDGLQILKGSDTAATAYLKKTTTAELTNKFKPVIDSSLKKFDATKYWADVFNAYNKVSLKKVNPDLTGYVTDKALSGLFYNIALQEQKIRNNPAAQVTDILKKVFGK
jgi:Protein of unknown function (DUF4197)